MRHDRARDYRELVDRVDQVVLREIRPHDVEPRLENRAQEAPIEDGRVGELIERVEIDGHEIDEREAPAIACLHQRAVA